MKRYLLGAALAVVAFPACAQLQFRAPDNINNTAVSAANPLPVTSTATAPTTTIPSTATAIYSGQQTVTISAVALPSQALVNGIVITAPSGNTGTVYVGPAGVTTGNGYKLAPGSSISYAVTNVSAIYIIGTAADTVSFTGN